MLWDVLLKGNDGFVTVQIVVAMSKVDAMHIAETLYGGIAKDAVEH